MSRTNIFSSIGLILGTIALLTGIIHFSLGPLQPQPSVEQRIAEKVIEKKKRFTSWIQGTQSVSARHQVNPDKVIILGAIFSSVIAILMAVIGGMRKESRWSVSGALFFGSGTLIFYSAIFNFGILFSILILLLVITLLAGAFTLS